MVIDVTEQDFREQVVDKSATVPVVVDFWAEWCGPCRQLTPVLERETARREGAVVLAKLDTDANPRIAQAFEIRGIPAVKAFRDGRVVDEFVGVKPPDAVASFFDALAPSKTDALVDAGDEDSLRRALELEPRRADAAIALARILHARGDDDEALALVREQPGSFAAEGLGARITLERAGEPDLGDAFAALDAGQRKRGLDLLIDALADADGAKDDIRRVVVAVLDDIGADDPLAREYRRRLAAALY